MTIQIKGVCYETQEQHHILSNINLILPPSQKIGLVGANGVGKTTLAKIIAGKLTPTTGIIRKDSVIEYLEQHETPPECSLEGYLSLEGGWQASGSSRLIADLLNGLDEQRSCQRFSGGEWMRIRIAKAILAGADYLVFDEPSNNLDKEGQRALQEFITNFSGGVLLISHDRQLLGIVDAIAELTNQGLSMFGGNWDFYEAQMRAERDRLASVITITKREKSETRDERQRQIERQQKRSHRGSLNAERTGMSKEEKSYMKRRAQGTDAKVFLNSQLMLAEKIRRMRDAQAKIKLEPKIYAHFTETTIPSSALVFETKDLNFWFSDCEFPLWQKELTTALKGPLKVAIIGKNGSGKSTLLKLIAGASIQNASITGGIKTGGLPMAFLDQSLVCIDDQKSVLENVKILSDKSLTELRNLLAEFLFQREKVWQLAATLSGGERLRLALAKILLADPAPLVLLLDEPTNNVDIDNITFLETALEQFRGALIIVSHDQKMLEKIGIDVTIDLEQLMLKKS